MALPKRKHSKARRDKSRTHWKCTTPTLTTCPQCSTVVPNHCVCPQCGHYHGRSYAVGNEE